jgi:hypothetical protein
VIKGMIATSVTLEKMLSDWSASGDPFGAAFAKHRGMQRRTILPFTNHQAVID